MNSRSSQVLLYTAGDRPSAPASAAPPRPPCGPSGRTGRARDRVCTPRLETGLCHGPLSDPCCSASSSGPQLPLCHVRLWLLAAHPTPHHPPPLLTAAGCHALVGAIGTVLVAITEPALGDTHMGARAGEGVGATRFAFCGGNRELLRPGAGRAGRVWMVGWASVAPDPLPTGSPPPYREPPSPQGAPLQTGSPPHHSEPPRPSRPRSHRCRHTATAWRCSDGSGTQTGPQSRTCLGQ